MCVVVVVSFLTQAHSCEVSACWCMYMQKYWCVCELHTNVTQCTYVGVCDVMWNTKAHTCA